MSQQIGTNNHSELGLEIIFNRKIAISLPDHPTSVRLISSPMMTIRRNCFNENQSVYNSNSLEIPQPTEVEAKSNFPLMLKEEEQGEEILTLPSPRTLNDMMSKIQKSQNNNEAVAARQIVSARTIILNAKLGIVKLLNLIQFVCYNPPVVSKFVF
ncbi:Protein TALPID3 [Dirofilaria immitis]